MRHGLPRFIFFLIVALFLIALLALAVTFLWNYIFPPVFGWKPLTIWQGLALLLLSKILFSGFGWRSGPKSWRKHRPSWRDKWKKMSPEEREALRAKWRDRCG